MYAMKQIMLGTFAVTTSNFFVIAIHVKQPSCKNLCGPKKPGGKKLWPPSLIPKFFFTQTLKGRAGFTAWLFLHGSRFFLHVLMPAFG